MHTFTATNKTWILCHNNDDVLHINILEIGDTLQTGQPEIEDFDNEEDCMDRVEEITSDPEYFNNWKENNE